MKDLIETPEILFSIIARENFQLNQEDWNSQKYENILKRFFIWSFFESIDQDEIVSSYRIKKYSGTIFSDYPKIMYFFSDLRIKERSAEIEKLGTKNQLFFIFLNDGVNENEREIILNEVKILVKKQQLFEIINLQHNLYRYFLKFWQDFCLDGEKNSYIKESTPYTNIAEYESVIVKNLILSIEKLLEMRKSIKEDENSINNQLKHYLSTLLTARKICVKREEPAGLSYSGKKYGSLDFYLSEVITDRFICLIEAFKIESRIRNKNGDFSKSIKKYVKLHIVKTLNNYDFIGRPFNFIVVYSNLENFNDAWRDYVNLVQEIMEELHNPKIISNIPNTIENCRQIKSLKNLINDSDNPRTLYHFFMNYFLGNS